MPSIRAALAPNPMIPSETTQVTCGTLPDEFNLPSNSKNGAKQVFLIELHKAGRSCVASRSDGGNPSGMVSNRKSGRPFRESDPLFRINRL